jgi:putative cardiolipin synthase
MAPAVLARFAAVQRELEMITPYFVPSRDELETLAALRSREVRVRLLTTSLDASDDIVTQAAYERARKPLLAQGVEIHELRAKLGDVRGSGEPERLARFGHYSLHAKLFVFDDDALFIGSMNLDQRSKHLNTEIGLIISSADLARQVAGRFDAMSGPEEAYAVTLQSREKGDRPEIVWTTQVEGRLVSTTREPTRHPWRRFAARLLSWLPIRGEL